MEFNWQISVDLLQQEFMEIKSTPFKKGENDCL